MRQSTGSAIRNVVLIWAQVSRPDRGVGVAGGGLPAASATGSAAVWRSNIIDIRRSDLQTAIAITIYFLAERGQRPAPTSPENDSDLAAGQLDCCFPPHQIPACQQPRNHRVPPGGGSASCSCWRAHSTTWTGRR